MKKIILSKLTAVFLALVFAVSLIGTVTAGVGVGLSPSKIVMQVEGGKAQEISLLVFNTGDAPLTISLTSEGDIGEFVKVEPESITVDPEPKPEALPIRNGKNFKITITPPKSRELKKYTGTISAIGKPQSGSTLGGSVGVATQVELTVTPPPSIFAFITTTHLIILAIAAVLIALIIWLRKAGFSFKIEKKAEGQDRRQRKEKEDRDTEAAKEEKEKKEDREQSEEEEDDSENSDKK